MRALVLCLGLASPIAGCGSAAPAATISTSATTISTSATTISTSATTISASAASCAALTPRQQLAAARAAFTGRFLAGPTARIDGRSVLLSPARVRVSHYSKGRGPAVARVDTAVSPRGVMTEDGIEPAAGQQWRIYTTSPREPYATSICIGSERIGPHAG